MTDTVKITLTDGTTMDVHPDTPVGRPGFEPGLASHLTPDSDPVTVFEPVRQCWTPYEPWMRDVLAADARVSWRVTSESRAAWSSARRVLSDALAARYDLRVHPDDVPERPTEDDPDEALAKVMHASDENSLPSWRALPDDVRGIYLKVARAAREHIEREQEHGPDEAHERQEHGPGTFGYCSERRARKDAEADLADMTRQRDEWKVRYAALRADGWLAKAVCESLDFPQESMLGRAVTLAVADVLDRDDERGEQA